MPTRIKIIDESYSDMTESPYYDEEHGGEDTYETHDIMGFEVAGEKSYFDLTIGFEPEKGMTYYLLYTLRTGDDSFNHRSGIITFVDLFQDQDIAVENERRIEEHNQLIADLDSGKIKHSKKIDTTLYLILEKDGTDYKYSPSWCGYFERLEGIVVMPVLLREAKKNPYR